MQFNLMNQLQHSFIEAISDYLYLLEHNYSQKSILKLVGDRYQLKGQERSMLFRGVQTNTECESRKEKQLIKPEKKDKLYIDGYNIIRTIGSYLLGKTLFISMDGFLRDASEMHRATLNNKTLKQTLKLIFEYFDHLETEHVEVFLDQPISKSGELASELNKRFSLIDLDGLATTVHSPDYHLKQIHDGIVCTADSNIIDSSKVKVFDLAKATLDFNFHPEFIDLTKFTEPPVNN